MNAQESQDRQPGLVGRVQRFVEEDRKKIGGMTLGASLRLGLAELREAFSLGGNIEQPTPYGMYGTLTPGEVASNRRDDPQSVQQMEEESQMDKHNPMNPGEIIDRVNGGTPGQEAGKDRGNAAMHGNGSQLPTPGQIIDRPTAYLPEQQEQHGQEHGQEQEHGRGM